MKATANTLDGEKSLKAVQPFLKEKIKMIRLVSFVIIYCSIQLANVICLFPGTKLFQISTITSSESGIRRCYPRGDRYLKEVIH